jgi:hypothetical protein
MQGGLRSAMEQLWPPRQFSTKEEAVCMTCGGTYQHCLTLGLNLNQSNFFISSLNIVASVAAFNHITLACQ